MNMYDSHNISAVKDTFSYTNGIEDWTEWVAASLKNQKGAFMVIRF